MSNYETSFRPSDILIVTVQIQLMSVRAIFRIYNYILRAGISNKLK